MKCYYDHTHHHFLDYFNDPIPDDTVIYAGGIPFSVQQDRGQVYLVYRFVKQ